MVWPPDEIFRRSPYPYCQIVETPGSRSYPYSLVVTYADDLWNVEPMLSLEDARQRAEEWHQIWLGCGSEAQGQRLITVARPDPL